MEREELVRALILYAASGKLDERESLFALLKLVGRDETPATGAAVLEALRSLKDPALADLISKLQETRRQDALTHHRLRSTRAAVPVEMIQELADLPLDVAHGWKESQPPLAALRKAMTILTDRAFAASREVPGVRASIESKWREVTATLLRNLSGSTLAKLASAVKGAESLVAKFEEQKQAERAALAPGLEDDVLLAEWRARFAREKQAMVDRAATWPTRQAAALLAELQEPEQERAGLILSLRFGVAQTTWQGWLRWLQGQARSGETERQAFQRLVERAPAALLAIWCTQGGVDPAVVEAIEKQAAVELGVPATNDFIDRWEWALSSEEWQLLSGAAKPVPVVVEPPKPIVVVERPKPVAPPKPVEPPPPAIPPVWDAHLKPFLVDNWYMVAGIVMVVVGSSLLAYYTWDKHWLVRYTLMPALLGGFTTALAWVGGWIERRDAAFKATAATLRSAAIGLLPVNFMALVLLARDPQVAAHRGLAVGLMSLLYLGFFGWGLQRWCAGVHPALRWTLGGGLLLINSLIVGAAAVPGALTPATVGVGFYGAFFVAAAAVIHFAKRTLTAELAAEKRVVWFFGATLAVTFLQVFAWIHGFLRSVPQVHLYAPMVILVGWLVLFTERRTLALRGETQLGAESFLGFAFVLLGVLMGIAEPWFRVVCMALAAVVWLSQRQPLHHWIGLTFGVLAVASIGLVPGFPRDWWPALGLGAAVALAFVPTRPAAGMQPVVLLLTLCVTVLSHYEIHYPPLRAAGFLVAIAALFGWRAWRDQSLAWFHTAMIVLALSLPYAGGTFRPSLIITGLGVLSFAWIGVTTASKSPLLRNARSTVLFVYGALALACMVVRAPNEAVLFDVGGPLLMTVALVFTTYFSRSLIPAGMAVVMAVVLAPEVRSELQALYPQLAWGSGLGSASIALGLALVAFALRAWPRLEKLGEGDLFLGRDPYPLRRLDATLFTWPLLASVLFLVVKVDTWNFIRNVIGETMTLKASIALCITGAVWTLLAVFFRKSRIAIAGAYLGLGWLVIGIAFGCRELPWHQAALAIGIALQAVYFVYRALRPEWVEALLTRPARHVLRLGAIVGTAVCVTMLVRQGGVGQIEWLILFTMAQLVWHGLATRHLLFGAALVVLTWATVAAGREVSEALTATLWMALAAQLVRTALEAHRKSDDFLLPVTVPFQAAASGIVLFAGCMVLGQVALSSLQIELVLVGLVLTARLLRSGPFALLTVLVGYVFIHRFVPGPMEPWHTALLGLALALLGHFGGVVHQKLPVVVASPRTPTWLTWPAQVWLYVPAALVACGTALLHTFHPVLRESGAQIAAPYIGAATMALLAASTRRGWLSHIAGVLLTIGNVHLLRVTGGEWLRGQELSELHIIVLGIAGTLVMGSLACLVVRWAPFVRLVKEASLAWAGLVLALLSANYLAHPDLAKIEAFRFGVSGSMALLAGLYFRRAARHPGPGEEPYVRLSEGFYHFGVTMAVWCAALMIPWMRSPVTAIVGLGLPVVYFYLRAEDCFRRRLATLERYRHSAATLGFLVLALYTFRSVIQMVIFPEAPFQSMYYHWNSPFVFLLGCLLLRLHALGGTSWLAFYGGLAVMGSTYFALTALPGLSPFAHPVASAWCAIGMAHFFTIASVRHSPLKTAIQRLSGVDAQGWAGLRRSWGICLLVASQGMVVWGIFGGMEFKASPLMVAPLVLGAASVWVLQGVLRQSGEYLVVAAVQGALALHMGFILPSYLPKEQVVWAVAGLWGVMLIVHAVKSFPEAGKCAGLFGLVMAAHVGWHEPASPVGLAAVAVGAVLLALTPRPRRAIETVEDEIVAGSILPWVPTWLVFFGQLHAGATGLLATAATFLLTGAVAAGMQAGWAGVIGSRSTHEPRLMDQVIAWMGRRGSVVHRVTVWVAFGVAVVVQGMHYGRPFTLAELGLIELIYAGLFTSWLVESRLRKTMAPNFLMQVCVLGAFLVVRQQWFGRGAWLPAYDVWASLAAFFGLVAARQFVAGARREVVVPLTTTLMALPVFSVVWVMVHHLGSEMGLIALGLHSAAFTWLAKEERESPYGIAAVAGFVAFIVLLFVSKLHLREVYAYVVPVGVGVLVLLQLFQKRVAPEVRAGVRTTTLLAMLGSAGYAVLTESRTLTYHDLALVLVCVAAMGIGGLLRIRLFVVLGFGALMMDLGSLFVKTAAHMERSVRMTVVGSLVLVVGAGLVFGAIWYKTHQKEMGEWLGRWKGRLAGWE